MLRLDREQAITDEWFVKQLVIHGYYGGLVNGLNLSTDVLHAGNLATSEVTGVKKFTTVEADHVFTQFINDVDVVDWFTNAVRLNSSEEQYIDGHVDLANPVFYNDIQVDGLVNGIDFRPETLLTKSGEGQVISGDLTLQTMTEQEMKPLFIEYLYLSESINGWNVTDMFLNTFKRSDTKIDCDLVTFENKLIADSVTFDKLVYGVNVSDLLGRMENSKKLEKFQSSLAQLEKVGDDLRRCNDEVVVELSHFEFHQSLLGVNIQKTVPLTVKGAAVLAVHERNTNTSFEVVRFNQWHEESQSFVDDATIAPMSFSFASYELTKLDRVVYKAVDYLFVELFEKESRSFFQSLMTFDEHSRSFVAAVQTQSPRKCATFHLQRRCHRLLRNDLPFVSKSQHLLRWATADYHPDVARQIGLVTE